VDVGQREHVTGLDVRRRVLDQPEVIAGGVGGGGRPGTGRISSSAGQQLGQYLVVSVVGLEVAGFLPHAEIDSVHPLE
jgi:hypothetical protein